MSLINIDSISKSYSEKMLLNNISLSIDEGDKIGVIGINGTGKTTLLKLIAGVENPDEGRIMKGGSVTIEYLPQNPDFDDQASVLQQVFKGSSPVMELIREYEEVLYSLEASDEKIMRLTQRMDTMNAWSIESEAKSVLTRLGISDFNAKIGSLSGGERKRVALASALITPCDLLILDEPTNHLDNDTIDWLEQYLNKRKGALLMVTHDRYFLDRVANKIIELDRGNLYTYRGNYSIFLEKKLEREELEAAGERKRQNLFRKELAWIKRGAKARSTKQKARIERFEKLSGETIDFINEKVEISVAGSRLGKKVIEIDSLSKYFEDRKIIDDFSYVMLRNDRIGVIGPNGSGKTTLLNMICGLLEPDRGKVEIGETVKLGFYSQENPHIDDDLRVIEYIKEGAEILTTADGQKISAAQMLERFLFPSALQWTPIARLSGGEKRRLYLLRVLMEAPNVLLMDEPTNDLDIETLTILEDYLEDFQGAVVAVSHDRYFLDRIAEKIFAFEGNGKITQHTGNYSDFKEFIISEAADGELNKTSAKENTDVEKNIEKQTQKKDKPLKFSYKEQREFEEIDSVIAGLEDKIEDVEKSISDASTDYTLLQQLLVEKEDLEKQLEEKMERWIYLNELAEKIENAKSS